MKRLMILSAFTAMTSPIAFAQDACRDHTLEGTYALSISGTRPAPGHPGVFEQVIGVGIRTFDGDGNFTQVTNEKGSVTGILVPDRALQGTYFINPDCTGTLTLSVPNVGSIVYDIVVASDGRKFDSIVASPTAVMVVTSGQAIR